MAIISLYRLLFEEPEAGSDAVFGKYMFDDQRREISKSKKEPPTEAEEDALSALSRYVAFNDKEELGNVAPTLLKLKRKGLYSPLLDPARGGRATAYRIFFMTPEAARQSFGIDGTKSSGQIAGGVLGPRADSPLQGWTTDPSMFHTILRQEDGKPVYVLLKASLKKNDNFFGNPKRLAGLADEDFKHERETLAIGPVSYDRGVYFTVPDNTDIATIKTRLDFAIASIK